MEMEIDFTGDTKENLEKAGPSPGWFLVDFIREDYDQQKGRTILQFKVIMPQQFGLVQREYLDNPALASTQEEREKTVRKIKTFAMRMGLTEQNVYGTRAKINFSNAVGRRYVLHLQAGKDRNTGERTETAGVWCDWAPYPLDHARIPVEVRELLKLPLLPGQVATGSAPAGSASAARPDKPTPGAPDKLPGQQGKLDFTDMV